MKLRSVFLIMTFAFFVVGIGWAIIYLVSAGNNSYNHQVEDYLVSVINSNEERIGDVFSEVEGDVLFLAESDKVRDILRKDVDKSESAVKFDVDGRVSVVAREIENYILSHSDMTTSELVKSKEFKAIATQKVGETGYAAIIAENAVIYLHVDPRVEGSSLSEIRWNTSSFRTVFDEAVEIGVAGGFYIWTDINGNEREKYAELRRIGTLTSDGMVLYSVTSAYVDDYLIAQNVSESLDNYFVELAVVRGYHNILFVSKDNRIVHMAGTENGLGIKLKDVTFGFGELSSFIGGLEGVEIGFYGPFTGHVGESPQFAVASRVYDGEEFLGTIVILEEMGVINGILREAEEIQLGYFDEDYIVNEHGLLITPLRARNVDMMVQEIRTESVEECLGDFLEAMERGITVEAYDILEKEEGTELAFLPFLNYNGDLTLGLHRPIGKVNWCVLSEVNAQGVLDEPMEKSFRDQIEFRLWVMLAVVLLTIGGSLFIDKRYVLEKKKKVFRENFFTRLGLGYYLLFGVVFAAAYLYVVTLFFQGIQNAKLFDAIPDMLVFVVGVMIFAVGMKIKDVRARYFIIYGGLLICLRRLFDIPFQEWQVIAGHLLTPFLWVPVLILEFSGFLLLLIGYRRLKNV